MKEKTITIIGLTGTIIGVISICLSCILIGFLTGLIGLALSITAFKNKCKNIGVSIAGIVLNSIAILIATIIIGMSVSVSDGTSDNMINTNEIKNVENETAPPTAQPTLSPIIDITPKPTEIPTEETKSDLILSEHEYKELCKEMYYDDIFLGEENLEGEYLKLHLFLSEKYYFTVDNMYSSTYKDFDEKYNMNKDFYKCCVLHKGTTSYFGSQLNMWFSNDYELNPSDYKTGQKIIVYAKVISWSNNTWDGHNSVTIIPRYIETEE